MRLAELPYIGAVHQRRRPDPIRVIVIHDAETPETQTAAENVARYFASGQTTGSAHVCTDSDSAVRCAPDRNRTNHTGGVNDWTLGYEMAGYASQSRGEWLDVYSRATLVITAGLVAEHCDRYQIPKVKIGAGYLRRGKPGICGHADVSAVYKAAGGHTDPGENFPWDVFIDMVRRAGAPSESQLAEFFELLAELQRINNNRKRCPMWLISHSDGAIYTWNGVHGWHLPDPISLKIQQDLMLRLGLPAEIVKDQDYFIDRLREDAVLSGV